MDEFVLVYGLQKFNGAFTYYYPEPFIAKVAKGRPSYLEKNGNDEVLISYQIKITDTPHEEALQLCRAMHPSALTAELNKGQKKTVDAGSVV